MRFSFSLKASLSQPYPSFHEGVFACLMLEISIQLFFLNFLFSGYFCSVDACVVCIVSGHCNRSSSAFLNGVFEFLYRCIDAIINAGEPSSYFFS